MKLKNCWQRLSPGYSPAVCFPSCRRKTAANRAPHRSLHPRHRTSAVCATTSTRCGLSISTHGTTPIPKRSLSLYRRTSCPMWYSMSRFRSTGAAPSMQLIPKATRSGSGLFMTSLQTTLLIFTARSMTAACASHRGRMSLTTRRSSSFRM